QCVVGFTRMWISLHDPIALSGDVLEHIVGEHEMEEAWRKIGAAVLCLRGAGLALASGLIRRVVCGPSVCSFGRYVRDASPRHMNHRRSCYPGCYPFPGLFSRPLTLKPIFGSARLA